MIKIYLSAHNFGYLIRGPKEYPFGRFFLTFEPEKDMLGHGRIRHVMLELLI